MGLFNCQDLAVQCPLTAIAVEGRVTGTCAHITTTQTYVNADDHPIEAVYIFPLSDESAVTGLEIRVGDRRIRGEVKEAEEAFETYDDAVSRGDLGVLLEQRRPNVFEVSVGNVLPDEPVSVTITTVEELAWRDFAVQLRIPTVVGPRYIPGKPTGKRDGPGMADPTDHVPDADHITPPVTQGETPYRVRVDLEFTMPGAIERLRSPTHDVVVDKREPHQAKVELIEEVLPDRDIIVECVLQTAAVERVIVDREADAEGGTFLWSFMPDLPKPEDRPKEVVFVIDHSGSMGGRKMEQARTALLLCLRSLDEGDRFNVIQFDDSFKLMHRGTVELTQKSLEQADRWIKSIEADGGTEMLAPLREALAQFGDESCEPILVLLTDGEVGNDREIVQYVKREQGRTRVFTFGIDSAVNSWLLRELASNSGGAAEFITPDERVEEKVLRQFTQIATPLLRDVEVEWQGAKVDSLYPAPPWTLFWGRPLTVLGRIGTASGEARLALRGRAGEDAFETSCALDLSQGRADAAVRLCWAKRHLKSLEDAVAQTAGRRETRARQRLLGFALEFGLASSATSFVAIEERPSAQPGVPETRVIPVMLPYAWVEEGLTGAAPPPSMTVACQAAPGLDVGDMVCDALMAGPAAICPMPSEPPQARPGLLAKLMSSSRTCEAEERSAARDPEDLPFLLASMQALDGSWGGADVFTTSLVALAFAAAGHDLTSDLFAAQLAKAERWLTACPEPADELARELREAALQALKGEAVDFSEWADRVAGAAAGEAAEAALAVLRHAS